MPTSRIGMLVAVFAAVAVPSFAQDSTTTAGPWKFSGFAGLNLSQSAFSTNWHGGDRGSIVWVLTSQTSAERQFSSSFNESNTLNLAYGATTQQVPGPAPGQRQWGRPDKTTDQIALQSVGRWTLQAFVDPYAAVAVESQFKDQTDPRGSIALNPVQLKESVGLARVLFHSDTHEALTRVGFALRQTFASAFTDPLGDTKKRFTTNDGGLEWQTDVKQPVLHGHVLWTGRLLVYQPLFFSKSDDLKAVDAALRTADPGRRAVANYWKTTNVEAQSAFAAQITKSIGVNLIAEFVYVKFDEAALVDPALASTADAAVRDAYIGQLDKNVRRAGQYREVLSLALTYKLF